MAFTLESKINAAKSGGNNTTNTGNSFDDSTFKLFNPNANDFFKFQGEKYDLAIKNINGQIEKHTVLNQEDAKAIFTKFAANPTQNAKNFSTEEKGYLVNWIIETIFFLEINDKTIALFDLLRILTLNEDYTALLLNNEDKVEKVIKFFDKDEGAVKDI